MTAINAKPMRASAREVSFVFIMLWIVDLGLIRARQCKGIICAINRAMICGIIAKSHAAEPSRGFVVGFSPMVVEPRLYEPAQLCRRHRATQTAGSSVVLCGLKVGIEVAEIVGLRCVIPLEIIVSGLSGQLLKECFVALVLLRCSDVDDDKKCLIGDLGSAEGKQVLGLHCLVVRF